MLVLKIIYLFVFTGVGLSQDITKDTRTRRTRVRRKISISNLGNSTLEIYDFHVPSILKLTSAGVLACGYRETPLTRVHQVQWFKDDIIFFSYQPGTRQHAHIYPDTDWLDPGSVSYMVDPVHVNQEPGDVKSGFNISVLTVRFDRIDEKMSGVYKCNLSLSLLEPGPGDIRVLRSRSGRLTVLSNSEQVVSGPDIELDISTGYRQGDKMHLMCSSQGSPAPYLVWSYIRGEEQNLKEETPVGRSKLETYPLSVSVAGVETRKLGLSVLCCSETKFSCSLQSGEEMLKTEVELVEHDKVWRLEMINPEVTPEDQKQEEEELEEEYDWRMNIFVWIGFGTAGICFLSLFICCLCCCICSHNKRMTRKRRNQEILRREIYNKKKRGCRSRSLSRRSTKRKAPDPSYSSQDPSFTSPDPDPSYPGYILEQQT